MSAFYSFRYADRVHVLTDAGFFDDEGKLQRIGQKFVQARDQPLIIVGRGAADIVFGTFRDIFDYMRPADLQSVDAMLDVIRFFFAEMVAPYKLDAEFLVAAVSETQGPCHFFIDTRGGYNIPMFELCDLGRQIGGGPAISLSDISSKEISSSTIDAPDFPQKYGAAIMEAMRRKPHNYRV